MNKCSWQTILILLARHEKTPQQQGFRGLVDAVADWFVDAQRRPLSAFPFLSNAFHMPHTKENCR